MVKNNLISVNKAILNITSKIMEIKKFEKINLNNSLGRILSKPVISKRNNPYQAVSAMDGFAVNYNNINKKFKIMGESKAGSPFKKILKKNEAVQIFTGAFVPKGANTIIIQENISYICDREFITFQDLKKDQNIRKKGVDLKIGQIVANKNEKINSRKIASIAMSGNSYVHVKKKPIIGVLSTGNELQNIGESFSKYKIISGNNLMISSIISVYGGFPKLLPIAPDDINKIEKILNANLDCDFFVSTGGASVGKYDYLHEILNKKSKHTFVDFWKIAMRPGKPLIFGKYKNIPILGLPGNPVSAGVCSLLFLKAAINKLFGTKDFFPEIFEGSVKKELKKNDNRMDFIRAIYDKKDKNKIEPFDKQDSSMMNVFSKCDCLIVRKPYEEKKQPFDKINYIKFPEMI